MIRTREEFIEREIKRLISVLTGLLMLTSELRIALDNLVQALIFHTTQVTQFRHGPDEANHGKGSGQPSKKHKSHT